MSWAIELVGGPEDGRVLVVRNVPMHCEFPYMLEDIRQWLEETAIDPTAQAQPTYKVGTYRPRIENGNRRLNNKGHLIFDWAGIR